MTLWHGHWICGLEDRLMEGDPTEVQPTDLLRALQAGEYFYDLSVVVASEPPVKFGLIDSTFLFLEGPKELVAAVASEFNKTEIVGFT